MAKRKSKRKRRPGRAKVRKPKAREEEADLDETTDGEEEEPGEDDAPAPEALAGADEEDAPDEEDDGEQDDPPRPAPRRGKGARGGRRAPAGPVMVDSANASGTGGLVVAGVIFALIVAMVVVQFLVE